MKFFKAVAATVVLAVAFSLAAAVNAETAKLKIAAVEASTTQKSDLPQGETAVKPENILDGVPTTRWASEFADNQWLILTLAKKSSISKVVIKWEAAYAKAYKLLVSNDKKTWKEFYSTENGAGGNEEITLNNAKGKYIKIELIRRGSDWGFSILDLEVLG
jgi:hypothetical protein